MKNVAYLLLLALVACNPLKKVEKVEAVIGIIPMVQIMGGPPSTNPGDMDPMRYAPYFNETLQNALNEAGIKTRLAMRGEQLSLTKPTQISIQLGMVSIHDMRPHIIDPNADLNTAGLQMMLMGGFGSVDKDGQSVAKTININIELKGDELASVMGKGPSADPIKAIIDMAITNFVADLKIELLDHLKKNG